MARLFTLKWLKCGQVIDPTAYKKYICMYVCVLVGQVGAQHSKVKGPTRGDWAFCYLSCHIVSAFATCGPTKVPKIGPSTRTEHAILRTHFSGHLLVHSCGPLAGPQFVFTALCYHLHSSYRTAMLIAKVSHALRCSQPKKRLKNLAHDTLATNWPSQRSF